MSSSASSAMWRRWPRANAESSDGSVAGRASARPGDGVVSPAIPSDTTIENPRAQPASRYPLRLPLRGVAHAVEPGDACYQRPADHHVARRAAASAAGAVDRDADGARARVEQIPADGRHAGIAAGDRRLADKALPA